MYINVEEIYPYLVYSQWHPFLLRVECAVSTNTTIFSDIRKISVIFLLIINIFFDYITIVVLGKIIIILETNWTVVCNVSIITYDGRSG